MQQMQEQMNSMNDSGDFQDVESNLVEGCLTFPVNLRWFRVLAPCSAATKDCHLTHGITLDYRKTFMEINFLRLIHPEIILKEFNLTTCKETEKQSLKQKGWWLVTQERTHKIKAQFQCRHLRQGRWLRGLQYRWNYNRTTWSDSKYRSCHSTNSLIHNLFGVTNTIQKPSDYLFWFSIGCRVVNQGSGDGWFFGRVKIFAINLWKGFSKFGDAGREDCIVSEQDHPEFPFQEEGQLRRSEHQKEDRFPRGSQIAFMIYDHFRVTGAHDTVLDYADLFSVAVRVDNIQEFDTRWDEVLLSSATIPSDDILESLYRLRIRESDQLKTVLELYDLEIHRKILFPKYQNFKTMVKESIDQKLRLRNFDAGYGRIESGAVVKSRKGLIGVEGGKGICYQWKEKGQCSQGDRCNIRTRPKSCAKTRTHCRHTFWANRITRSKCVEEEKYPKQK